MAQLSPDALHERLREYFQARLNKSLEHAYRLPSDPQNNIDAEVMWLREQVEVLRRQLKRQSFDPVIREEAAALLDQAKPDSDLVQHACNGVLRARIENNRILAAMLSGEYETAAPLDPLFVGMKPTGLQVGASSVAPRGFSVWRG